MVEHAAERRPDDRARLDDYRNAGLATADQLGNSLLLGTLLVRQEATTGLCLGVHAADNSPPARPRSIALGSVL